MAISPEHKRRLSRHAGRAAARLIDLVHRTSRIVFEPADAPEELAQHHPAIIAVWHGQFMMLASERPKHVPFAAMVARHGDAEVIGEAMSKIGVELIRGAGAGTRQKDRGGAHALRAAMKALEDGKSIVMTADVPPGPARIAGTGIVALARLVGTADRARRGGVVALQVAQHVEPDDDQPAVLDSSPMWWARRSSCRARRARRRWTPSASRSRRRSTGSRPAPMNWQAPIRAARRHRAAAIRTRHRRHRASASRPTARRRSCSGPRRRCCSRFRERAGKEDPSAARRAAGACQRGTARGRAGLGSCGERRRDECRAAADRAAWRRAQRSHVSADHGHRDFRIDRGAAARAECHPPVRADRFAGMRAPLSRSLAARSRAVHRIRDLAQPRARNIRRAAFLWRSSTRACRTAATAAGSDGRACRSRSSIASRLWWRRTKSWRGASVISARATSSRPEISRSTRRRRPSMPATASG